MEKTRLKNFGGSFKKMVDEKGTSGQEAIG
jgi:hypothetical protein